MISTCKEDKPLSYVLFLQYAKDRGIEKALEIILEREQKGYRDVHEKAMIDIWNPEELWAGWPEVIKSYGLLTE